MEMKTKIDNFIVGTTTEFWASVVQKRKKAHFNRSDYDRAAEINQFPGIRTLHDQDEVVKGIFREMVSYITEVRIKFL